MTSDYLIYMDDPYVGLSDRHLIYGFNGCPILSRGLSDRHLIYMVDPYASLSDRVR